MQPKPKNYPSPYFLATLFFMSSDYLIACNHYLLGSAERWIVVIQIGTGTAAAISMLLFLYHHIRWVTAMSLSKENESTSSFKNKNFLSSKAIIFPLILLAYGIFLDQLSPTLCSIYMH